MADPYTSARTLLPPPSHGHPPQSNARHKTGRQTPWLAFFCIFILLGSIVVSIAIIASSNNRPVKSWKIQPAVWLSIMSSIFTLTLEALVAMGLAICWWRSVAHGTTLKRLHYISGGSNILNLVPAVIAGADTRKVALTVAVIALSKFASGPLLQRSTHAKISDVETDVAMKMHIAQQLPDGFYGSQDVSNSNGIFLLQSWYFNDTLETLPDSGFSCKGNGTCSVNIPAAGLNYGCDSTTQTLNLLDPQNLDTIVFNISTYMNYDFGQPMLFLSTMYLSSVDGSCMGTITTDTCNIIPATVEYPISIQNTTISLNYDNLLTNRSVVSNYTSPGDKANLPYDTPSGPLTGLNALMGTYLETTAVLVSPRIYDRNNSISDLFFDNFQPELTPYARDNCGLRWDSPTDYIISQIFTFMFLSAFQAGLNESYFSNSDLQNFTAHFSGSELHYHSNFRFLAAAIVVMILGLLGVLILLWGWWELGRPVTLSPLETAKAFGAPILLGAGHEKEVSGILDEVGEERVAHDGDELIWNGTMYAARPWQLGQVPSVREPGRPGSAGDSPRDSLRGSAGGGQNESPKGSPIDRKSVV